MSQKKVVIYCRYSSDMQRPDSCADQERAVRAGLAGLGVPMDAAVVIRDEAESGTKSDRAGFRQLCALVTRGAVAVLAVDDQSRLSRGDGAYQFVQDLVFAGGRFVSTGEGIDTDVPGWELKVQVLQLHHGQTVRDLRHRVRRGQRGRVEADGSAGDFPYGYESYYLDDDWAAQLARRGPKPKKGIRVCAAEAEVVRRVFDRFVDGNSINWIAHELTRLKVPKGHRASQPGWHPQQVHRMLTNAKYVGTWAWGRTATVRDSQGRKKQTAVAADEVVRARPELRIVEQAVWDRAQARLAELDARYGHTEGQKRRGPRGGDEYPRSPLGGLLTCAACGARMWQHRAGARRYYACSGAKSGRCAVTAQVPADRAEKALADLVLGVLRGWPDWVQDVYRRTCAAVRAAAERVPADRARDEKRRAELDRAIGNIVAALANGLDSPSARARLRADEAERAEVERRLAGYAAVGSTAVDLPDEAWVAARLAEWAERAATADGPGALLRHALAALTAEPVVAAGKARGFVRLRVRVRAWAALSAALGDALRVPSIGAPDGAPDSASPEFVLDLGSPTPMGTWAERITEWRAAGVTWTEIVRRTGLDLNRAYCAWKRFTGARATTDEIVSSPPE